MQDEAMKISERKTLIAVLWGVGFSMGILFFFTLTQLSDTAEPMKDTYLQVMKKTELLSKMRINLHKSVEMEKNAVMALTDEQSQEYANQSLTASASVEQDLKQLQDVIAANHLQVEEKFAGEFSRCWAEFRKLDHIILGLAIQNTNLKAETLSQKEGAATVRRFEQALKECMRLNLRTPQAERVTAAAWQAIAVCLQIFNMHNFHIAEINDEKMEQIETQIQAAEKKVLETLDLLAGVADKQSQDTLLQAKTAFSEFMEVTVKVLKLSKINSNIKSLDLSIGRKRIISAQCEEILASFQSAVQNRPFKAAK